MEWSELHPALMDHYHDLSYIGSGSQARMLKALDKDNKPVAIKILDLKNTDDWKNVELFEREAELLQSIHVEGVPKFLDYLTDDAGNGYLIQEYIQAESIQDFLDNNYIFPEAEALDIARKLARIIYELQSNYSPPIIHRDIKPSNILYDDQNHRVYLIDFGSVTHPQKKTGGSTIAGTFGYMPPEQMVNDVVIQSDYYAIGATLLHMITGVFPGNMSSDMFQIDFVPIIKEKAPDTTDLTIYILQKLLSKDPDARSKSPSELIELLSSTSKGTHKNIFVRFFHYMKKMFSSTPGYAGKSSQDHHQSLQINQNITKLPTHENDSTDEIVAEPKEISLTNDFNTNEIHSTDTSQPAETIDPAIAIKQLITIQDTENNSDPESRCTFVTLNWEKCKGTIQRQVSFVNEKQIASYGLEYTFSVNGFTYVGRCYSQHFLTHIHTPFPCQVIYNPKYPTRNALYSFDKETFVK